MLLNWQKCFKVSDVTVRQDLEKLEKEGLVIREHGGAFLSSMENNVRTFTLFNQDNIDNKRVIAKKSAELIDSADTTYLVGDSTKIGKNAFASLGALSLIDYIIKDTSIDDKKAQALRDQKIKIIAE